MSSGLPFESCTSDGGTHTRSERGGSDVVAVAPVLFVHVEHRIRATLKELHDLLDPATFVRVHRGTILNLDYIREIQPWFSGDHVAILQDGEQIRISRHYREDILRTSF